MIELGLSTLLIPPHALATQVHLFARDRLLVCLVAQLVHVVSSVCSRAGSVFYRAYALVPYNQHASNSRVLRQNLLNVRVFAAHECQV